jgi:hypothetical protein
MRERRQRNGYDQRQPDDRTAASGREREFWLVRDVDGRSIRGRLPLRVQKCRRRTLDQLVSLARTGDKTAVTQKVTFILNAPWGIAGVMIEDQEVLDE